MSNPDFLDSLPYIDQPHPSYESYALTLIEDEMLQMSASTSNQKKDYLSHLPLPTSNMSSMLNTAYEEIVRSNGVLPIREAIVMKNADRPKGSKADDINAWRETLKQMKSNLETNNIQLTNLELLDTFGQTPNLNEIKRLTRVHDDKSDVLQKLMNEIDTINAERKNNQDDIAPKYNMLVRKFYELVEEKKEIDTVNEGLREGVKRRLV